MLLTTIVVPGASGKKMVVEQRSDGGYDVKIYAADGGTVVGNISFDPGVVSFNPTINVGG